MVEALLALWLGLSAPSPAAGPVCPRLQLRATPAAREGYACSPLAEGLAVCYLCEDRPITTDQLARAGSSLAALEAQARAQSAAAVAEGRPLRQEIGDMPGSHYWVSADGDGLDVAALLHPDRLQVLTGQPAVVAVPGEGTLLAWVPGDAEVDKIIAVGVRRMHDQARRPVSPHVYRYHEGEWSVWAEIAPTTPASPQP